MSEPAVEPSSDLVREVESALVGLNLNEDITLYYTVEALHELSCVLGGALHNHVAAALAQLEEVEDTPGDLRELMGVFCGDLHLRFQRWLRDRDIAYINWWTHHSSGHFLRWSIDAAAPGD